MGRERERERGSEKLLSGRHQSLPRGRRGDVYIVLLHNPSQTGMYRIQQSRNTTPMQISRSVVTI
jgi:hypothetical protein